MTPASHIPEDTMKGQRICVAAFSAPHGVRGAVRLKSFTENPDDVSSYGPLTSEDFERSFDIDVVSKTSKGELIVKVAGVDSREAAERLKGERLYVDREKFPTPDEEEFYHADLIGLRAKTLSGKTLGEIRAVFDFGAGDTLEILPKEGAILMVPFTKAIVPVVDLDKGHVLIDPPEGLLEEKKKKKAQKEKKEANT